VIERLEAELSLLRTGRQPPVIVKGVVVEDILANWRGVPTPLKLFAAVEVESSSRRVTVRPFDSQALADVEKALQAAGLGVAIAKSGSVLQFALLPLTAAEKESLRTDVERLAREAKASVAAGAGVTAGADASKYLTMIDELAIRARADIAAC
jgi:ribosome recycling factor